MLASDLHNPEFTGAIKNPDDLLEVEFYMNEPIDKWESEKQGKKVKLPPKPFVRYSIRGDKNLQMDVEALEMHKMRWPSKWLYFAQSEGLIESQEVPGWSIDTWDELEDQPELIRDLKHARFYTVEQISNAHDTQIGYLGMVGAGLREKAKRDMAGRINEATKQAMAERDKEINTLKDQNAKMMEMMQKLMEMQANAPTEAKASGKKRGRKPKARAEPEQVSA